MPQADGPPGTPALGAGGPRQASLSGQWARLRADSGLGGRDWSRAAVEVTDRWLESTFRWAVAAGAAGAASTGPYRGRGAWWARRPPPVAGRAAPGGEEAAAHGLALLAVGSLGRGDLAPASDLDLLLVHTGRPDVAAVADRLWYPIWDDPMPLDHSVRTLAQVEQAAESDLRVAQGLLDARLVAGDPELGRRAVALGQRLWDKRVGRWLPEVMKAREEAWAAHGDVAFLLEAELQEGRGGLRDLQVLALMAKVSPVLSGLAGDARTARAGDLLHAVRVELQRQGGRRADRLMLEDQERVAVALGLGSREALAHEVAGAGRDLAWATEEAFRRARSWLTGPSGRRGSADRVLGPGLVLRDNEVVVPAGAGPAQDPTLALRAAAASAQAGVPIARPSLARLAAEAAPPPVPWPEDVLRAFTDLLATGHSGTHLIETLDQLGIWERYLPEWPRVRNRPQFNPYHRWTVDRHLLEAVANASRHRSEVHRPDLLLLAALCHDIGKGTGGDHSEAGAAMTAELAYRLGLGPDDAGVLEKVVRHHLLLPETATRRDLDDPATVQAVADAVADLETLELLAAVAPADGEATGPSAWSDWKAGLVRDLSARAHAVLSGRPVPPGPEFPSADQRRLLGQGGVQVVPEGRRLTVVAPDRHGLLSSVAGALSLHGAGVLEAKVHSEGGTALEVFTLEVPERGGLRWERVAADIEAAASGRLDVGQALARRPPPRRRPVPVGDQGGALVVLVDNQGATGATLVEVRSPDSPGALHRITAAIAAEGLDIASARAATLGGAVVDTFYVTGPGGGPLPEEALPALRQALEHRLRVP